MTDNKHLDLIQQGVFVWNEWREDHPRQEPSLSDVRLSGADLPGVNLIDAKLLYANLMDTKLTGAKLRGASLQNANLSGADLMIADLSAANLYKANLRGAKLENADLSYTNLMCTDLRDADLSYTNLSDADLCHANLRGANLSGARMINTRLFYTNLSHCRIYGISAWNLHVDKTTDQSNLIITLPHEPTITTDNLEVAQFLHLLINNQKIRRIIDTITSKVVLVLGRFTKERKTLLDAIREQLLKYNYLPVVFDFEKPSSRDITETISTLAHVARFVIADITDAKSIPQELERIVPDLPSVPIQPLLEASASEYGMFSNILRDTPGFSRLFAIRTLITYFNLSRKRSLLLRKLWQ